MKQALAPTVKTSLLAGFFLLLATTAWAQRPVIQAIERTSGSTGQVVLIKGSSFGGNKDNLRVKFGAVEGVVESATDQTLKVSIPAGTTYSHVTVTNLLSNLSASTQDPFLLSFSGEHPFDATSLDAREDFPAEKGIEDICLCDVNNDGLSEVITTHKGVNTLSLYRNSSTPGNVALARVALPAAINTSSLHVKCGDLNGDGLQDLVVTEGATVSERIFVIQNSGAFAFTVIPITIPGFQMADVAIGDLDLDGRPDLVVTNQTKTVNNTLAVLRNTTVGAATSFNDAPVILTAPGDATPQGPALTGTDAIDIQDMNGDGRPDILAGLLLTTSFNNVYIFANQTTPGTMNFATPVKLPINNGQTNNGLRVGDLDGDGKAEIAYTNNLNAGGVFIFRNTSSGSSFSFTTPLQIPPPGGGWGSTHGIDFGDVDGDGKTDIVIGNSGTAEITIINNNSTPGSYSFTSTKIPTILPDKYVRIGDLDGDGKPDIVFPSFHFTTPYLSVLRNKSCVVPKITPDADVVLCTGLGSHKLEATHSPGSYYEWKRDGILIPGACGKEKYTLDIATTAGNTGDYTVTLHTESGASCTGGSCIRTSESVTVTILSAGAVTLDAKSNSASGQVCKNTTITLSANATPSAGLSYTWTGPDGYFETTSANSPPTIVATSVAKAGEYTVQAKTASGCVAGRDSTVVEVIEPPATSFAISGPSTVRRCVGDADFHLELVEAPMAFTYEWFKDGTNSIGFGAISPPIQAQTSFSGKYHVVASSTGCGASIPTLPVEVLITTKPVVSFTISPGSPVCKDQQVTFESTSVVDGAAAVYQWTVDVGAGIQRPNAATAEYSYPTTGLKTVRLSIHYGNNACLTMLEQPVQVNPPPAEVSIETTEGTDEFCAGETLSLEVSSTAELKSFLWSTGENTPSITVPDGGVYTVDVAFTTGACVVTKSKTLTQLPAPVVTVTGTPERINEGETSQLTASGLDTYLWEPAATLSNATVPNPAAQPVTTTEYTVTGVGANGCPGSGTFILQVVGEAIVNKLNPHNFFSPNNDGPNEQWQIDEILAYAQCGVTIYDDKGVKVFEAKPYHNDWNGTFNGKQLPDGVYFYIIRCDGEESTPRAGSITLLR